MGYRVLYKVLYGTEMISRLSDSMRVLSLVKIDHLVHQDSLRQCTTWELEQKWSVRVGVGGLNSI